MSTLKILTIVIGMLAAIALFWPVLVGPSTSKECRRRLAAVRFRHSDSMVSKVEAQLRKAVQARKPKVQFVAGSQSRTQALALRLNRTGKTWTIQQYAYVAVGLGLTVMLLIGFKSGAWLLALVVGIVFGAGLPHMVVNRLVKKRQAGFTSKFPDAIELLVRGLRSGLPVTETLGVVAQEVPGPVGEEFKMVTERIKIGRTMEDALQETSDRLDTPEFAFFVITLAIQRETGGNLAETLSNLADVLRKRAQMKLKIRAMSSEAKASAYIVGALPFLVFAMVWYMNPTYLGPFFVDERLMVVGMGGLVWMGLGAFIMAQMVNFEI